MRQELKVLWKKFELTKLEESQPIAKLCDIIRKKLISLLGAEWHRRRRTETETEQEIEHPLSLTLLDLLKNHLKTSEMASWRALGRK